MNTTLEDHIMSCWQLVDEIELLSNSIGEEALTNNDDISNVLSGLKILYQRKFELLFASFEEHLKASADNIDDHHRKDFIAHTVEKMQSYPPGWPFGDESKKKLKDEFDLMIDHAGYYEP